MTKTVEMTKKDWVMQILDTYGCATSRQISVLLITRFDKDIPATSIGGILRAMADKGQVASSPNEKGANVYWLV